MDFENMPGLLYCFTTYYKSEKERTLTFPKCAICNSALALMVIKCKYVQ